MRYWSLVLPEAATNLIANPSFETNTTGWAEGGTNVISQSAIEGIFGAYSLKSVYKNSLTLGSFALTLTASTTYHLSCWVYVPSGWDGGDIHIEGDNYTSAVNTNNDIYTDGTSSNDTWIYLEAKLVLDTDTSGEIKIICASTPTVDKFIYIDAVQVEANASYATTYIDGEQPGCKWAGAEHASKSEREAQSRAGGRVYNLDDYSFYVSELTGFGMPPIRQQIHARAMLPGAEYKGYSVDRREFVLISDLEGTSWTNLHSKRQALIDGIKPDKVKGAQPFLLRYTGADSEKALEIECVYIGGLEFGKTQGFTERIGIRIAAYDPFFYELGNDAAHLTVANSATMSYCAAKINGEWDRLGPTSSGGLVEAILEDGDYIYVGGNFTNWNGIEDGDYIARYNKITDAWSALDTGLNAFVTSMLKHPDGKIYIGGDFTDAGDADGDYFAYYDPSTDSFSSVSSGGTEGVKSLVLGHDNTIYIGGDFNNWNAIDNADYIVSWDGSAYAALGTGMGAYITALAIHPYTGDLYAAGNFTTAGGNAANYIAKWNGTAWSTLGTGFDAWTHGLHFMGADLYIGGEFTTASGNTMSRITKWNGKEYSALSDGVDDGIVQSIISYNNFLYIGGTFSSVSGLALADTIAAWNGSTWFQLDVDLPGSPTVTDQDAMYLNNTGDYFVGFNTSGTATYSYLNTVTNNGTSLAYPKIVIERSGGTSSTINFIKNEDTGDTFWLDYALLDGEVLTIDLTPGNRTCSSNKFGDVWRSLLRSSDLSSFSLLPGDNRISIYIEEVGSPTTACYMTWRNTHWSCDGVA